VKKTDPNDARHAGEAAQRPKDKVNNVLSARGLNLAKEALPSEKKFADVLNLPFDEIVRVELRVIVSQIRSLNQSIAELEKTIGEEGAKL